MLQEFCNIINAFTVTFDQLNVSLHNKSIKKIKSYWPKRLNGGVSVIKKINTNFK